jgi:hypothetical protein
MPRAQKGQASSLAEYSRVHVGQRRDFGGGALTSGWAAPQWEHLANVSGISLWHETQFFAFIDERGPQTED